MKDLLKQKALIVSVLAAVLLFVSLVSASLNLKKYKRGFQDEMALRLDLEEKILKLEKERQGMRLQLEALTQEASKNTDAVKALTGKLKSRETEMEALKVSLESARGSQVKSPMQP